jgi:hypothetical protein
MEGTAFSHPSENQRVSRYGEGKGDGMSRKRILVVQAFGLVTLFLAGMVLASSGALGKGRPSGAEDTSTDSSTSSSTVSTEASAGKVLVCHVTHSKKKPFHTISVSVNALPAHLAHGDSEGACGSAPSLSTQSTTGHGKSGNARGHNK